MHKTSPSTDIEFVGEDQPAIPDNLLVQPVQSRDSIQYITRNRLGAMPRVRFSFVDCAKLSNITLVNLRRKTTSSRYQSYC